MLREQSLRAPEPVRVIVAVGQARQPQELVDDRLLVRKWLTDRLLVWRAGVTRDQLQMRLELGPARKPELASDHKLSIGTREAVQLRGARLRVSQARVELVDEPRGAGVTGTDPALKRLRAVLELREVGVAGKTAGWHKGLLSPEPGVRNQGRKGEPTTNHNPSSAGGLRPFRGPAAPCAHSDHNPPHKPPCRCKTQEKRTGAVMLEQDRHSDQYTYARTAGVSASISESSPSARRRSRSRTDPSLEPITGPARRPQAARPQAAIRPYPDPHSLDRFKTTANPA
jgi:hypothetical protein